MKLRIGLTQVVTRLLQLLKISLLLISSIALADGTAGLTYYTYRGTGAYPNYTTLAYPTVLSTGISSSINYNWGGGYVLDSGRTEQVLVHWTGYVLWPGSGSKTVYFYNSSDDGFLLKINGTTVINNWAEQGNAYYNSSGAITLTGGQAYYIDIWYYENGGGAVAQLYWNTGAGITIVPSTSYATSSTYWAPAYSSSITAAQQTRKNSETSQRLNQNGNEIQVEQIGDNNTINIRQGVTISGKNRIELYSSGNYNSLNLNQGYNTDGTVSLSDSNNHYQYLHLTGNSNSVTTKQTGNGQFMENTISGNNNTLNYTQTDSGSKTLFSKVNGNSNTINATQTGTGNHYLDINLLGNGHSVTANQSGSGSHAATIDFTNAGGSSSLNLNQSGSTSQTYSIQQSCTNPAGCSTTITQP